MHFSDFLSLLLLLALEWNVEAIKLVCHDETFVPDAVLRVTAENHTTSCLPSKSTVLVNGTSPGPELRLVEGRTYWIRVYNDMPAANLTMHWHGLSMAVSPFADGTPSTSQWPIPPMHFFDYEVSPAVGMAGTYFYHSHVGFQAVSAAGPLIIDDCEEPPYKYDGEKIVFIGDTFTGNDSTIEAGLVHNPLVWSGEAAAILVNGQGGGTNNGTACNATLSSLDVEPGKTYRFRFIGGTALTFASLAIEGHSNLTVIEADGSYTEPYNTSFLQVAAGQRYSVLLTTKPASEQTKYFMQLESRERPTVTRGYAVLNYGTPDPPSTFYPPAQPVMTLPNTTLGFLDYDLHPHSMYGEEYPSAQDVTRTITMTVHQRVTGPTIWVENNYNWTEQFPQEPYLVSLYKNDGIEFPSMERALANNGIDPVTRSFPAQIGEVIEIVIQNTGADAGGLDAHPFHAHGAHYWDLGSGNGTYNATANNLKLTGSQPVKRDTTMLYRYAMTTGNGTRMGWRAWRLKVTEPGVWMIHCHILQHMLMGMQTVWVMGNSSEVLGKVPTPEVEGYLTYGGDVYGNETHAPNIVQFSDDWEEEQ
ncbi:L-ascorbate oxidase [Mollisia scopiformis]|uniref:L-ascorbate oxidase n=1 Tax=Mollisia scopiformis TaxID=149040 RepID=A0A132B2G1_MOLSC|nr:L-ascorbate oxidase [Mollisia scopiformis]KUJ06572.1 L-ascorbate oxidase [Mollisia scopiformis]